MSTPWGWGSLASGPPPSWWKSPPSGPPPGQRPGHGLLFQLTTSRLGVQDPIPGSTLDDTASLVNESFLLICLTITSQCVPHLLVLGRGLISTGVFFLPTIPGYFFLPTIPPNVLLPSHNDPPRNYHISPPRKSYGDLWGLSRGGGGAGSKPEGILAEIDLVRIHCCFQRIFF